MIERPADPSCFCTHIRFPPPVRRKLDISSIQHSECCIDHHWRPVESFLGHSQARFRRTVFWSRRNYPVSVWGLSLIVFSFLAVEANQTVYKLFFVPQIPFAVRRRRVRITLSDRRRRAGLSSETLIHILWAQASSQTYFAAKKKAAKMSYTAI